MDQEKKTRIIEKIENVEKNISSLRNDIKGMNEDIILVKNLIGEYLLLNTREEVKKKVISGENIKVSYILLLIYNNKIFVAI